MFDRAITQLSPAAACRRLEAVDLEEKSKLAEGLVLLALVDERGDYLDAGYASMHRYCTERLHMSEAKASKRIQVARLGRRLPLVIDYIADGRLSVSHACELAPVLTVANARALLDAAAFKSKLELRRLLHEFSRSPQAGPTEGGAAPGSSPAPASPANDPPPADEPPTPPADERASWCAPAHTTPAKRGRVTPNLAGEFDVHLTLTVEEYAALARATDLLSHVVRNGDPAVIVARALAHYVERLEKQRFGAAPGAPIEPRTPRGRGVPKALRRFVAERDGHCCAFVSADGHRCGSTRSLQLDHVVPLSAGGATTADNLRLLCAAHNRREAERTLGADHVRARRELAERVRAERAAAKLREERRTKERGAPARVEPAAAAPESPDVATAEQRLSIADDLVAALCALGFRPNEARYGARLTESAAGESLETRLKSALKLLTRQVVARSERVAKGMG